VASLEEENAELRAFAREKAAEAADLRLKVQFLEREQKKILRRLNRVYRSWTWRAGRLVLFPYHFVSMLIERRRKPE